MFGAHQASDELVAAAVTGEPQALDRLLRAAAPQVRLMVAARLSADARQYAAVEDISQVACMSIIKSLPTLKSCTASGFKAFASTIVSRRVADHLRNKQRVGGGGVASLDSTVAGLPDAGPLWQFLSASGTSPLSAADRADAFARVMKELGRLKPEHRDVITLALCDQLSTTEIAEQMDISRPAVSMLLIRALNAIRKKLGQSNG